MELLINAFNFLKPNEKRRTVFILVLVVGLAIAEMLAIASVMPFLIVLSDSKIIYSNVRIQQLYQLISSWGISGPDHFLISLGCLSFIIILLSALYRAFVNYLINDFIEMTRHSISSELFEKYLKQPYVFNLTRHSSDLSKMVLSEVDEMVRNVYMPIFNVLLHTLVIVAIFIFIVFINTYVAFLVVIFLGTIFWLIYQVTRKRSNQIGEILVQGNKDRFIAISEAFNCIKPIKIAGMEAFYQARYSKISLEQARTLSILQTIRQTPNYLIEIIIFGTIILITLILLFSSGGLSNNGLEHIFPIVGLNAFSAYRMKPSFYQLYTSFVNLRYGKALINNISPDWYNLKASGEFNVPYKELLEHKKVISLDNVHFTYLNSKYPALNDVNIRIPLGSSIGITGTTGAGKTTLVDIFLGLLRPDSGAICIDGKPIVDNEISSWQRKIGYVPQDIFLLDSTIAENIALGISIQEINHDQIKKCAEIAQIAQFIEKELPNQYNTIVGERGVRLSGGQRQRIGIARALYQNPEILVFDEATSALDIITERMVLASIGKLQDSKTIIFITHRISTIQNCDQIIRLEHGQIVQLNN
jgi:ABC-type bacteriocin/lantibiotic exporter with double-glycine peptidase domain